MLYMFIYCNKKKRKKKLTSVQWISILDNKYYSIQFNLGYIISCRQELGGRKVIIIIIIINIIIIIIIIIINKLNY